MKVLFCGNHNVGISSLSVLSKHVNVVGVLAHPTDPEEGVRYDSVHDFARNLGLPVIRGKPKDSRVYSFIDHLRPDLIWVTDYRYLIPKDILALTQYAVNLHPSLLPKYRGRAPINWAIINNESEIGLTAHFIDAGVDSGDILAQHRIPLEEEEDIGDALQKLYPVYEDITLTVIHMFKQNRIISKKQEHSKASVFPARSGKDGLINWNKKTQEIHNLVRAVSNPYPGAFSVSKNGKLFIWKAERANSEYMDKQYQHGTLLKIDEVKSLYIKCCDGVLIAKEWTSDYPILKAGVIV